MQVACKFSPKNCQFVRPAILALKRFFGTKERGYKRRILCTLYNGTLLQRAFVSLHFWSYPDHLEGLLNVTMSSVNDQILGPNTENVIVTRFPFSDVPQNF